MNSLKQITTARKLSSLEGIELVMDDVCRNLGVEGTKAYFITLAISELASNMIRHASRSRKLPDDLFVEVFTTAKSIIVVLEDRCEPLSKHVVSILTENDGTISEYDTTIRNLPESGWGLDLLHTAANSVSYKRKEDKNVYEVAFDLMSSEMRMKALNI